MVLGGLRRLRKANSTGAATDIASLQGRRSKFETEERTCSICLVQEVAVMLEPCHHAVLCVACAAKVSECPICRTRIRESIRGCFADDYVRLVEAAEARILYMQCTAYDGMYNHVRLFMAIGALSAVGSALCFLVQPLGLAGVSLPLAIVAGLVGYIPWFITTAAAFEREDLGQRPVKPGLFTLNDVHHPLTLFTKVLVFFIAVPTAMVTFFLPYALYAAALRPVLRFVLRGGVRGVCFSHVYVARPIGSRVATARGRICIGLRWGVRALGCTIPWLGKKLVRCICILLDCVLVPSLIWSGSQVRSFIRAMNENLVVPIQKLVLQLVALIHVYCVPPFRSAGLAAAHVAHRAFLSCVVRLQRALAWLARRVQVCVETVNGHVLGPCCHVCFDVVSKLRHVGLVSGRHVRKRGAMVARAIQHVLAKSWSVACAATEEACVLVAKGIALLRRRSGSLTKRVKALCAATVKRARLVGSAVMKAAAGLGDVALGIAKVSGRALGRCVVVFYREIWTPLGRAILRVGRAAQRGFGIAIETVAMPLAHLGKNCAQKVCECARRAVKVIRDCVCKCLSLLLKGVVFCARKFYRYVLRPLAGGLAMAATVLYRGVVLPLAWAAWEAYRAVSRGVVIFIHRVQGFYADVFIPIWRCGAAVLAQVYVCVTNAARSMIVAAAEILLAAVQSTRAAAVASTEVVARAVRLVVFACQHVAREISVAASSAHVAIATALWEATTVVSVIAYGAGNRR